MIIPRSLIISMALIGLVINACSSSTPAPTSIPTPTTIQPAAGMGGLRGKLLNTADLWKNIKTIYIFAAEFHGDDQGKGVFFLEPSIHPHTVMDADGVFQINDMPPGDYVILAGPNPEEAISIKIDDVAEVFRVSEGEVIDIGEKTLSY
jgi:hypothetical protein